MLPERIRERYLQDPLPTRLGDLASDLARIASCASDPRDHNALMGLLEEGKWFAEWAAPEAPLKIQEQLAEVQLQLALWHRCWLMGRPPAMVQEEARKWSDRLLRLSGLA